MISHLIFKLKTKFVKFPGSADYWEKRYEQGKNSGSGSYNRLAEFKASVINDFVKTNNINKIIEFGVGDGNQLSLAIYPSYVGVDVSKKTIQNCIEKFKQDTTKSFFLYDSLAFCDNHSVFKFDLSLSLDVIYHLVEDVVFDKYMQHLFNASNKYVIIYSSNIDKAQDYHEKDRKFSAWVEKNKKEWSLLKKIDNPYREDKQNPNLTSKADFYIYQKNA